MFPPKSQHSCPSLQQVYPQHTFPKQHLLTPGAKRNKSGFYLPSSQQTSPSLHGKAPHLNFKVIFLTFLENKQERIKVTRQQ